MYRVTSLQACAVEDLPHVKGIAVVVTEERDEYGFPRVDVTAGDRDALLSYIRTHWGAEDSRWYRVEEYEARTFLVHLNIELPTDSPCTAEDIANEVEAALEVGTDPDQTPALAACSLVVALVDEI